MRNDKQKSTKYNPTTRERDRSGVKEYGVFVGIVISAVDLAKTGKLVVRITGLTKDSEKNFTCRWSSPFAGSTAIYNTGDELTDFRQTQTSYGMWMVPPDPGNLVLVVFAEGNISEPYVIGCLHQDRYHNMVPGIPAGESFGDPSALAPVAEKNKRSQPNIHDAAVRPMHADLAENITRQGLINDPLRGAGTSGSRRESPSEVFGILTPGALDESDTEFYSRFAGHQFVMDDNQFNRMIRLRSGGGNQIILDDVESTIYMINANGDVWAELDASGNMNIYAQNSINLRTNGNYNVRADGDINLEAGNDVNIKAAGDWAGGEYQGGAGQETDINTNDPPGDGGKVNITAKDSIHAMGDKNVYVTAAADNIELNSGTATNITATGAASSGAAINLNAPDSGGIGMTTSTRITMDANDIGGTAGVINFGGGLILLNSGPPTTYAPETAEQADRLKGTANPDVTVDKPEFDREAAIRGEPAIPNSGQRPRNVPPIFSIVTTMPTPEPYPNHYQVLPLQQAGDPGEDVSTQQTRASNAAGTPANKASPQGFQQGNQFLDAQGNPTTDPTEATQATYQVIGGVDNNLTAAGSKLLTAAGSLATHLAATRSASPNQRIPAANLAGDTIAGFGSKLSPQEAAQQRVGLNPNRRREDITAGGVGALNSAINSLAQQADGDPEVFAQLLTDNNITTSTLGGENGNTVYTSKQGDSIIDFSNGMTDAAAAALGAAELDEIWVGIRDQIPYLGVTDNQALAITDFARDLGGAFPESNVMQLLRLAAQDTKPDTPSTELTEFYLSDIPRLMRRWTLAPQTPGATPVFNEGLATKRGYQAALFETPDGANNIAITQMDGFNPNETGYGALTAALQGATDLYVFEKPRLGTVTVQI